MEEDSAQDMEAGHNDEDEANVPDEPHARDDDAVAAATGTTTEDVGLLPTELSEMMDMTDYAEMKEMVDNSNDMVDTMDGEEDNMVDQSCDSFTYTTTTQLDEIDREGGMDELMMEDVAML